MKDKSANNYTLEIIDSRDSIPFRRSNRYIAGSINGALLLEQIVYWYAKMGHKPFYKIKEPCSSPQYKVGQSWCEELGFSSREFDTAIKLIGQKISKNIAKDENVLVHYWVDFRRLTFYEINMELYNKLRSEYYDKELIRLQCVHNEQTSKQQNVIYDDRKCGKRSYVNAESAVSVNAESASGYIREYFTESTHINTTSEQSSPAAVSLKPLTTVELVDVYKQEFPNNPHPSLSPVTNCYFRSLLNLIRDFKKAWKADNDTELTEATFRGYLLFLQQQAPQFALGEYVHARSGVKMKNGLPTFLKVEHYVKFFNGEYS